MTTTAQKTRVPSGKRPGAAIRTVAHRPTRRGFLAGAGSLLALGAAGCGGAPSRAGEETEDARTVEHRYGTTRISGRPSRVVTVGLTEQDYVLALGVSPIGVREWFGGHPGALWPWAREALGDDPLPEILPVDELNFEQIAALGADLILGVNSGLTEHEYGTLSEIAPTVAQPKEHADYGAPWQEIARVVGQALGRGAEAEELVGDIEARFDGVRSEHPEFGGATALLAASIDGAAYVYAEGPAPGFLTQLGFDLPEAAAAVFTGENREPQSIGLERLDVLEADVLLMGLYGAEGESVMDEPVYRSLDVAREGRDLAMPEMSRINGALSFGSVLSLPFALDELVPRMAVLIDGDPDTRPEEVS